MENPKELYRLALKSLFEKNGTQVRTLAERVGCTTRHIHGILSEKERKGAGDRLGQDIAEFYHVSFSQMLDLGKWIFDGKDPDAFHDQMKFKDNLAAKTSTRGSANGMGQPSSLTSEVPSKSTLVAMTLDILDSNTMYSLALTAHSTISGHSIQSKPTTDSTRSRPRIPREAGHRFQ